MDSKTLRERFALWLTYGTYLGFAGVIFTSPWQLQWLDVMRRVDAVFAGYTDFFLYPSDIFIALTVICGLAAPFAARRRFSRGPWYFFVPLVGLTALSFLSAIVSVDPALTLYHSMRFLLLFGVYLALVNTPVPPIWIVVPLSLGVLVQGSVAILQFARQGSLGLQMFGELSLNPLDSGTSILRYDDVRILRAYGLTDHPNLLGGFLAFALIYILGYYLVPTHGRVRYLAVLPLTLGILALFFTFSRAAELALLLGIILLLVAALRDAAYRRRRIFDLALVAALAFVLLLVPVFTNQRVVLQRLGQNNAFTENVGEVRSLFERDALIDSANRIFYGHELLGVGNGALALGMYYLDKEFPKEYYYQPAHVVLLDAAAEMGILGGFFWLWLMVAPLIVSWVRRAALAASPWTAATAAVIVAMLVVGFFDYYTWFWQSGRIWQWSAWALFANALAVPLVVTVSLSRKTSDVAAPQST